MIKIIKKIVKITYKKNRVLNNKVKVYKFGKL